MKENKQKRLVSLSLDFYFSLHMNSRAELSSFIIYTIYIVAYV